MGDMQETGSKLKKQREEQGLTLGDIEKTTKISTRLLETIESGDFQRLPSGVFAKNFVRQYCEAINMNPEAILKEVFGEETEPEFPVTVPDKPFRWSVLFFVLFLCAVIFIVFRQGVWQRSLQPEEQNDQLLVSSPTNVSHKKEKSLVKKGLKTISPEKKRGQTIELLSSNPIVKDGGNDLKKTASNPKAEKPPESVVPGENVSPETSAVSIKQKTGTISIRFEAEEKCWVHLRCPDKEMDFILMKGELYTTTCRPSAVISVGNAEYIRVFVNNVRVEFPAGKRVVKDFDLTKTGSVP